LNLTLKVTNEEVQHGILEQFQKGGDSLACFVRIFDDIEDHLQDPRARDFIDIPWGSEKPDDESQKLLRLLRDQQVPSCLLPNRFLPAHLKWKEKGIDPEDPEHKEYLEKFLETFYSLIIEMVDRAALEENQFRSSLRENPVFEEILSHLSFCQSKCETFHGRKETLKAISDYISEDSSSPLVVYGESGCGKTSLMAKAAERAISKQQGGFSMIIRFLGTTSDSSTLHKLLHSLSVQISLLYGKSADPEEIPQDHQELLKFFHEEILSLASEEKPLVIFLDSLDQLSPAFNAHSMGWIPKILPPFVSLIVSTLPTERNCLPNLRQRLSGAGEGSFLEVPVLPPEIGIEILENWMEKEGRRVTDPQREVIKKALDSCSLPLYLRLVFNEAKRWKSYTPADSLLLPQTIQGMIEQLFDQVERQHGRLLVSHAFGLITASKNGLTEGELEDLLSLDDQVLQDLFQYWLPPIRRLPPLLWTRIRADVEDYLTERDSDGSLGIYWYHRQFIEVAQKRYLGGKGGGDAWGSLGGDQEIQVEENSLAFSIHKLLGEFFQGVWGGGKKKPFEFSERQVKFFGLKDQRGEEDRKVSLQPVTFSG